jgi:Sec-independent protein translocase protein TatA
MGWPEIAVLLALGLALMGPQRLPEVARQAARMVAAARHLLENAKRDLDDLGREISALDAYGRPDPVTPSVNAPEGTRKVEVDALPDDLSITQGP